MEQRLLEEALADDAFAGMNFACPECANIDDDQYGCTTCGCEPGSVFRVSDIVKAHIELRQKYEAEQTAAKELSTKLTNTEAELEKLRKLLRVNTQELEDANTELVISIKERLKLGAELSQYTGAVETSGTAYDYDGCDSACISLGSLPKPIKGGQRVKVWVKKI